ncbi:MULTISPECIES: hypothetical protein [unclassified Brevundimonas]|jgi:hypothetical protein|uniref:hypothetical protein n=1 Tax=unclassified Brevundimonas TaxID=2622653 RepID=UPI003B588C8D
MKTEDMKKGLDFINKVYEDDDEDVKIINEIFGHLKIGDIGTVKMILKSELEHCKNSDYKDTTELQNHIDSLSLMNKFCLIPYPDDIEHEHDEDYLIFMRYDLDGTRGEEKNAVLDVKYFLEMYKKNFSIDFIIE